MVSCRLRAALDKGRRKPPPPKGDTFVNGAEGCVRETRKGVLHVT